MKKIMENKKLVYGIIALIIVIALVFIYFFRLNFSLIYSDNTRLDIYIGKDYDMSDIEKIAKDVFPNQEIKYQRIETFNDTVAVTVKEATNEQVEQVKEKIKEKYELESTDNLVQTSRVAHLRGRDIVKPYIIPTAIATLIILIYIGIRYIKLGTLKVICDLITKLVLSQAIYLSIIAIFRLPIGIYTMPVTIGIYLLVVILSTIKYQNELEAKQIKENKK